MHGRAVQSQPGSCLLQWSGKISSSSDFATASEFEKQLAGFPCQSFWQFQFQARISNVHPQVRPGLRRSMKHGLWKKLLQILQHNDKRSQQTSNSRLGKKARNRS